MRTRDRATTMRDVGVVALRPSPAAFVRAYEEHSGAVLAYLRRTMRDEAAAEDVLHDVFLKAFRAYQRGAPPEHVRAWMLTVARTTAVDHWRRRPSETPYAPDTLVELADLRRRAPRHARRTWISDPEVLQALGELSRLQQEVVVLRYVAGCPHAETAELLGTSERAVIQAHHRALAALAARLSGSELAQQRRRIVHPMRGLPLRRAAARGGFTLLAPRRGLRPAF